MLLCYYATMLLASHNNFTRLHALKAYVYPYAWRRLDNRLIPESCWKLSATMMKGDWYNFVRRAEETDESGDLSMSVFGGFADEYDVARPSYPEEMWDNLVLDAGEGAKVAADVAAGTGRGCLELARRSFDATAIDLDPGMLERVKTHATTQGLDVNLIKAPAESTTLEDNSVDALICLQAFHWFDSQKAVAEFHRILRNENGIAVVAWNDRDLSVPWVAELEDVYEKYSPLYSRYLKLAEYVVDNGKKFTETGHFDIDSVRFYNNPTKSMTADSLIDLTWTFSYIRGPFEGESDEKVAEFEEELRSIVRRHHGDAPFEFPWVCKVYTLRSKA